MPHSSRTMKLRSNWIDSLLHPRPDDDRIAFTRGTCLHRQVRAMKLNLTPLQGLW